MFDPKLLSVTEIKKPPFKIKGYPLGVRVQHVIALVHFHSRGGRIIEGQVAASLLYFPKELVEGKFPDDLQKAKFENAALSIEDAIESKLHKRTGMRDHRGCFIFDRYEVMKW